jgi:diguanylate cyclase (GGDEF)-like protein/PAS domain S-box-containing protein
MQRVVSEQRNFSSLVNLAGHQSGLVNRIAYFTTLMATTTDESEFDMARAQVGRTLNKIRASHHLLRNGSTEKKIPKILNDNLQTIYEDPMVGLDIALENFLEQAQVVYLSEMNELSHQSAAALFLTTYGPHVLEPMLDAVVDEYQKIGKAAILRIETFEEAIWIATILTLFFEILFIFRPLEGHIRRTLNSLEKSITDLTATRKRLLAAQQLASVGDWQLRIDTGELTWSEQIYSIFGATPEKFDVSLKTSTKLIHPDDRATVLSSLQKAIKYKQTTHLEFRIIRSDGKERRVFQQTSVLTDSRGEVELLSGTIQDITERKELSVLLEKQSENIPGFIFQFRLNPDGSTSFPYASSGAAELCGVPPELVCQDSLHVFNLVHTDDLPRVRNKILASGKKLKIWQDQFRICLKDNTIIWVEGHATPERLSTGGTLWYGYIWNVTERKQAENQIRQLALYDPLTGLANRRLLKDRLKQAMASARRKHNFGAVLMLDMDNFKTLNDTQGHNIGDALLVEVGRRLKNCVRETDTIARLGGDEFIILIDSLGTGEVEVRSTAATIAEKIRTSLEAPYCLGNQNHIHHASASIGIALFCDNQVCEGELLKRADVAMFEAKELGRNRVCLFRKERQAIINSKTKIADELQYALHQNELSLYYQPQVNTAGNPCGAEALLRWMPHGRPTVSPATFIPIAEETGMILAIGEWVLESACQHINQLNLHNLPSDFAVAVNISARQFSDEDFLEKVKEIIARHDINTSRLKLELTETCLMHDLERGKTVLNSLREMGLHIELDDFGTGYSSLNSLKHLPLDTLKLDGSLIHEIEGDVRDAAIIRAAIAMAKALSLTVIAEGVETLQQSAFLIEEGCDVLQGYFHGRPMPFSDFKQYLEQHRICSKIHAEPSSVIPLRTGTSEYQLAAAMA